MYLCISPGSVVVSMKIIFYYSFIITTALFSQVLDDRSYHVLSLSNVFQ